MDIDRQSLYERVLESEDEEFHLDVVMDEGAGEALRQIAASKIQSPRRLLDISLSVNGRFTVGLLKDPEARREVAFRSPCPLARRGAVHKLHDDALLEEVLAREPNTDVRAEAARCLKSGELLARSALEDPAWQVRRAAFEELRDPDTLAQVAAEDEDPANRWLVTMRLVGMCEGEGPGAAELPFDMRAGWESYGEFLKTRLRKLSGQLSPRQWYAIAAAPQEYQKAALLAAGQIEDTSLLAQLACEAQSSVVRRYAGQRLAAGEAGDAPCENSIEEDGI